MGRHLVRLRAVSLVLLLAASLGLQSLLFSVQPLIEAGLINNLEYVYDTKRDKGPKLCKLRRNNRGKKQKRELGPGGKRQIKAKRVLHQGRACWEDSQQRQRYVAGDWCKTKEEAQKSVLRKLSEQLDLKSLRRPPKTFQGLEQKKRTERDLKEKLKVLVPPEGPEQHKTKVPADLCHAYKGQPPLQTARRLLNLFLRPLPGSREVLDRMTVEIAREKRLLATIPDRSGWLRELAFWNGLKNYLASKETPDARVFEDLVEDAKQISTWRGGSQIMKNALRIIYDEYESTRESERKGEDLSMARLPEILSKVPENQDELDLQRDVEGKLNQPAREKREIHHYVRQFLTWLNRILPWLDNESSLKFGELLESRSTASEVLEGMGKRSREVGCVDVLRVTHEPELWARTLRSSTRQAARLDSGIDL
eukprot:Skav202683  [mRNA]  locus=scaffold1791:719656:722808:+ [translate_table: standard]